MISDADLCRVASQIVPNAVHLSRVELAEGLRRQVCLVEAETFADLGGWQIDTQFIEAMGSSFLLAHGRGHPVADAVNRVTSARPIPRDGSG